MVAIGDMCWMRWRDTEGAKDGQTAFFFRARGRRSTLGRVALPASATIWPTEYHCVAHPQDAISVNAAAVTAKKAADATHYTIFDDLFLPASQHAASVLSPIHRCLDVASQTRIRGRYS